MTKLRWVIAVVAVLVFGGAVLWWLIRPEIVMVDQRHVEVRVKGNGTPAVIFENGFSGDRILWTLTQYRVAKTTRTLTYERAGLGRSDPGAEPRTAEQIARELHALLAAESIAPPYVVVGHSAGGMYIRVFAHMYPNEIAGIVLVDPATEEFEERMLAEKSVDELQKMGASPGMLAQYRALPKSIAQARAAWPLPSVPTVVISTGKALGAWPLETLEAMQSWLASHQQLVAKIPGSQHVVIPNADHLSVLRDPILSDEIRTILDDIKRKSASL
jgi:pimeloyl-ACP methyl ester carboxylesterase